MASENIFGRRQIFASVRKFSAGVSEQVETAANFFNYLTFFLKSIKID
jgi:hypothetical protein